MGVLKISTERAWGKPEAEGGARPSYKKRGQCGGAPALLEDRSKGKGKGKGKVQDPEQGQAHATLHNPCELQRRNPHKLPSPSTV